MSTATAHHSRIQEMEELIQAGQVGEVENVWLEAVGEGLNDPRPFLEVADRLASTDHKSKAAALLELLVDPLISADNTDAACEVINVAASIDATSSSLKETALKAYTSRFSDVDGFDSFIEKTESDVGSDTRKYVDVLKSNCSYKVGDYLFHDAGWGLGKVVGLDLAGGKLTIDFEEAPGHQVDLGAATRFFRKLPADHILALKAEDTKALKKQAKEDPVALFRCVLNSLEGVIKLRRIKEVLIPDVVGKTVWAKWWAEVKKELVKKGYARIGTGTNPVIEMLHIPVSMESEFGTGLEACHTSDAFAKLMLKYLNEAGEAASSQGEFLTKHMQLLFDRIAARSNAKEGEKVLAKLLLDEVKEVCPDVSLTYDYDLATLVQNAESIQEYLGDINVEAFERKLLEKVRDGNSNWPQIFADALLADIPDNWDFILEALRESDNNTVLNKLCHKIYESPKVYPEQMIWLSRHAISEGTPQDFGFEIRRTMFLTETLGLGLHLFHKVETGDKKKVQPTLHRFRALLAERDYRIIRLVLDEVDQSEARHLMHAIKMNRALSDTHVDNLHSIIMERFPDLAAEEEQVVVDDIEGGPIMTTPAGLRRKRKELSDIMNVEMPRIQVAIGEALALGDISENAELDAARSKEDQLKNQAARISQELERANVVTPDQLDTSAAGFGTNIVLRNTHTNEKENFTLLGRWDADSSKNIISDISAIGQGVAGARVGEERTFQTPDGSTVTYEILEISKAEFDAD